MTPWLLQTATALTALVAVIALRARWMARPRPLRLWALWVFPALISLAAIISVFRFPPPSWGWAAILLMLAVGTLLGWYRGKMTNIWRDEESGMLMRQSSAAAIILLGSVIAARFLVRQYFDISPSLIPGARTGSLVATDALMGLGVGFIIATQVEIAIRARRIRAGVERVEEESA